MFRIINNLIRDITIDVFFLYGVFSIVIVILFFLKRKKELSINKIDVIVTKVVCYLGILYFIMWLVGMFITLLGFDSEIRKEALIDRMFGEYWYGYWVQPFLWIIATQFLWFEKVRKSIILRLMISLILIISLERYVLIDTFLHKYFASF
ncbi:hypothetical protein BFR04_07935 [Gaetbulibacter sp. 4G1]|nr:hypothetical protein [Gaetbulibacter sp. 4G1]PIA78150.1 hypothetical protein BFR04_07935 [Gaetbulibacter sp. 4G1]